MILKLADFVLARDPKTFAFVYLGLVASLSVLFERVSLPATHFADRDNWLNVHLFKPAFNYTVLALLLFACLARQLRQLRMPCARLLLAWTLFSACKQLIDAAQVAFGRCLRRPQLDDQQLACVLAGHEWRGYRVSGHVFYLLYALLLLLEEAPRAYHRWRLRRCRALLRAEHRRAAYVGLRRRAPLVHAGYALLAAWAALLQLELLGTVAYFHAPGQKVGGALLAVALWLVTYGGVFRLDPDDEDDDDDDAVEPLYLAAAESTSSLGSDQPLAASSEHARKYGARRELYIAQKSIYKYSV